MTSLETAEEALRIAQSQPSRSSALASAVLTQQPDPLTRVVAERALGMAAKAGHDWLRARQHLERSIGVATSAGLPPAVAADARASLAAVLWHLGDTPGALFHISLARQHLTGAAAARLDMNRALIMQREGRLEEALTVYRHALAVMRRLGDVADEALLLTNRGILHAYRGEFASAEADLLLAEQLHVQLGQMLQAADVRHNLGFIAARKGDIPTALFRYDAAERERSALGVSTPQALLDRCEALLAVRLLAEARQVGELAGNRLAAAGLEPELAEARLLLAQAAILAGDLSEARRLADLSRSSFARQRRLGWLALADYALLQADHIAKHLDSRLLQRAAERTAAELGGAGWAVQALDAQIIAAQAALDSGAFDDADDHLQKAASGRRSGPADVRARRWYAKALLRHAHGESRGTQTALQAGIRAVADGQALLGATELRVHAAGHGRAIGEFGIRLALESKRAGRVLAWAERCRATAIMRRPPRPPSDEELASSLAKLRHAVSQVEEAGLCGLNTKHLLRQQAAVEAEIRHRTRHARGSRADDLRPPSIAELKAALGDAVLVEMVECDGKLYAVTVTPERCRLHALGPTASVASSASTLRFALGRLANGRSSPASSEAALHLAQSMAGELDRVLLRPLRPDIGDRSMVLAPTGILHALPWGTLPSCRGRALAISPSAALWLKGLANQRHAEPERTVLVAGPGLAHAGAEVGDLSEVYPRAETLVGCHATSKRFARAASGADLVHVAAHGSFRDDNPLLSSLQLMDGPVTVYDFETLPQPPRCLVLSACDAGLSTVRPGEELMGLSASLLAGGTNVLVASVTPARDLTSRSLMIRFHGRLSTGASAAEALAGAQETLQKDHPEEALAAGGFVCFGAGLKAV